MHTSSEKLISLLVEKAASDAAFRDFLLASLQKAKELALKNLDATLFKVLPWPLDLNSYETYLREFSKYIPKKSEDTQWKKLLLKGHRELDDRMSHFYWLIDQAIGPNKTNTLENMPWFGKWLVQYV